MTNRAAFFLVFTRAHLSVQEQEREKPHRAVLVSERDSYRLGDLLLATFSFRMGRGGFCLSGPSRDRTGRSTARWPQEGTPGFHPPPQASDPSPHPHCPPSPKSSRGSWRKRRSGGTNDGVSPLTTALMWHG